MSGRKYFRLQLKRALKLYPVILLITAITLLSVALVAGLMLKAHNSDKSFQKIQVGIVGDFEDSFLEIGIEALRNMDSSRFTVDFVEMNEEKAQKALQDGEIAGYIFVPDNYFGGIYSGRNIPATYYTRKSAAGFGAVLTEEITKIVSDMVINAQASNYSMQDVAEKHGAEKLSKKIDIMNIEYIEYVFNRSQAYDLQILGIADSITTGGYYICGIIMFFLLLWGISCCKLLQKNDISLRRALRVRGLGSIRQILCEYFGYFAITFITIMLFFIIAGIFIEGRDIGVRELMDTNVEKCIIFAIKIIPVILMVNAMQLAMCEMVSGIIGAILLQFITAVGLGFVSGFFYPSYFFPDILQKIGAALPTGAGFAYIRRCMTSAFTGSEAAVIMIYTIIFLVITMLSRKHRMEADCQ